MAKRQIWILGILSVVLVLGYGCKNQGFGPDNSGQKSDAGPQMMHGNSPMMMTSTQRNFKAHLSGRSEVPVVDTKGAGEAIFHVSKDGQSISYKLITSNINNLLMSHIHMGTSNENGPIVVWLYPVHGSSPELITGRFDGVLAQGTITADNLTGPLAGESLDSLITKMKSGDAYVQVHTTQHKAGEIRGQIK